MFKRSKNTNTKDSARKRLKVQPKNVCTNSAELTPPTTGVYSATTLFSLPEEIPPEDPGDSALRSKSEETLKQPNNESEAKIEETPKIIIGGKFQILHTVDDDDEPIHIVIDLKSNKFLLCRQVNRELYVDHMKLFERFSSTVSDDDSKILLRIWPDSMELFTTDEKKCYHVTPRHYGTLHSYVIDKKKLNEFETKHFYRQILEIVSYCHDRGIIVRDVKLRKFVFVDEQRRKLRLDNLDELKVCEKLDTDIISDRHGCPAYVSPEILDLATKGYCGKPSDVWGLGVLLHVMLMGRYPFYDKTPSGLFDKIRTAKLVMNERSGVSLELRWLIQCLLRKLPEERPKVREILAHPWLISGKSVLKFKCDDSDHELEDRVLLVTNTKISTVSIVDQSTQDHLVPSLEPTVVSNRLPRLEFDQDQELGSF